MEIKISVAGKSDFENIKYLLDIGEKYHRINLPTIFQEPEDRTPIYNYYEKIIGNNNLYIAKIGDKIVGFIAFYLKTAPNLPIFVKKKFAVIDNIVIAKEFRKIGIAEKLLQFLEEKVLVSKEIRDIELNVYEFNKPAIKLYEKFGYITQKRVMSKKIEIK